MTTGRSIDDIAVSDAPAALPSADWTTALTTLVAAAMAFLAVLTLAAGLAANRLASEWRADLAGVATVRVSAPRHEMDEKVQTVLEVLRTTPGIAEIRVLTDQEQLALLEPWLGSGNDLSRLPAPRLIDVELDAAGPDANALQARLDLTVSGVIYDDHAAWRAPLAAAARALERLAFGAAILVLLTAGGMVAFASRATLAANRHVIETVRLMGAEDSFLAGAFVRNMAKRALTGALAGSLIGTGLLALLPAIDADQALGATVSPGPAGWVVLAAGVPLAVGVVAWLSARTAVRIVLRRMP
ncbi:MAG: FtsX-like permease family protein [Pseudomonadota bacterium]